MTSQASNTEMTDTSRLHPHWESPANSYTIPGPSTETSSGNVESSQSCQEPSTPNAPGDAFVDIDLGNPSTPLNDSSNNEKKEKKKGRHYDRYDTRGLIMVAIVLGLIAGSGYLMWGEFHKDKHERSASVNSTNETAPNVTLATRDVPKVVLPLWDDNDHNDDSDDVSAEDIPGGMPPNEKSECSMRSKKPQCYTGHLCYKRKCVPWCKSKWNTCYTGHTCMLHDGSNWQLCSLDPEHPVPCTKNYNTCKNNGDCCTGSCEKRGEFDICVPPAKFERRPKGWKGDYWPDDVLRSKE